MSVVLNYIEKGYGTPLILLHGNGGSIKDFENQIDYFSSLYRVIAIETRGHGKSPRGMLPLTLSQFTQDLKHFFDNKNIQNAYILGFSDGGNIALNFALKYPQYVKKLILNGANIFPAGLNFSFLLSSKAAYLLYSAGTLLSKKFVHKKELLSLMVNEPNIDTRQLKLLKMPCLIIAGTHDLIKRKHTELIARSIDKSTLCFIEGGHFILKTNSVEFNKAVEKFLNS